MKTTRILVMPAALLFAAASAEGQTYRHNQVAPSLTATAALNASGNFVYRYTIANGATAAQRINFVLVELARPADGANAPSDWSGAVASSAVAWSADGDIDPSWVEEHEMDIPSFTSEIAPGTSRSGFEIVSACGGSSVPLTYYARGYAHLATMSEEEEPVPGAEPAEWRLDAVSGTVMGPGDCSTVADWGNRRPGVDGFLGLVNFASGAALPAGAVTVQVRFSRSGEIVNQATFSAVLNSVDVTGSFVTNSIGDKVAVFEPGSSPVQSGRNVLLMKVDGIKTGSTSTVTDADRFTFTLP